MKVERIEFTGYKGFVANRFGWIAETAKKFLARKRFIMNFLNAIADANSNKLVLAISTYIENEWFGYCTEIYKGLGEMIIFSLIAILGIDDQAPQLGTHRSWTETREFFKQKLPEVVKR